MMTVEREREKEDKVRFVRPEVERRMETVSSFRKPRLSIDQQQRASCKSY